MGKASRTLVYSFRRQHRLLWLLLGVGFSLFLCAQLVQEGLVGVGLMMGLLVTYYCAGQVAARLVARLASRSTALTPSAALFLSSFKVGVLFSIASILFHLVLLVALESKMSLDWPAHMRESVLLRAAIFPFLACLGAACTSAGAALTEPARVVHFSAESDFTPLTD
jgi:hypothetical protein